MSLRYEQYAALRASRALLGRLLDPKATPRVPRAVRLEARACLRHFPPLDDKGQPYWSADGFTEDREP